MTKRINQGALLSRSEQHAFAFGFKQALGTPTAPLAWLAKAIRESIHIPTRTEVS